MDDYLREMIEQDYKQDYKQDYEQAYKEACEQGAFESLALNIKSLINKGYSFDEACYMLDVDDKTREKLLKTGKFNMN